MNPSNIEELDPTFTAESPADEYEIDKESNPQFDF